jgi:ribosome-associated toxin RatA of RatAB toxin-antitoxin module
MIRRPLVTLVAALGLALATPSASAKPTEEAQRLMKKRDAERYEVQTPHSSIKAGAARVAVKATPEAVRKVVTDFKSYPEFISKFEKARVVGKDGDKTDVYLQVPILKGAAKVWAVVRFDPPKSVNGEELVAGTMLKGNVKRLDATWRIKKIDDGNTQLNLELLIVPKLPFPGSLVTGEVAYAADEAVTGSRDRAEKQAAKKK